MQLPRNEPISLLLRSMRRLLHMRFATSFSSARFYQDGTCLRRFRKQGAPRGIEIHPALRREPACWQFRHMQQTVAVRAHQLGAVPGQKISRSFPYTRRMTELAEAHRTPRALVAQRPAQTVETNAKGADDLNVLGVHRLGVSRQMREVARDEEDDRQRQGNLGIKKRPAPHP